MAEELGERTEAPSSRKLREARGRGQVAKSQDFGSSLELVGGFLALVLMGGTIIAGLSTLLRNLLDDRQSGPAFDAGSLDGAVRLAGAQMLVIAGPFVLVMLVVVFFGQFIQVGWMPTLQPLQPKLDRLNPLAGTKRLLSRRNMMKTLVGGSKMIVIGLVGVMVVSRHTGEIASLARLEAAAAFMVMGKIVASVCLWMLVAMLLIGLVDLAYQRWQHTKDLKMTKQEVKDELRSMEGDVETKGRRLRMARQIALQRLKQAVPKASVVVTNPTHFAIALEYDAERMAAPRVVAKGADFMAFRIREIAAAHRIPIVEKPALARALYAEVDVGRMVSPEFYEAVAEILAYVYRLEGRSPKPVAA